MPACSRWPPDSAGGAATGLPPARSRSCRSRSALAAGVVYVGWAAFQSGRGQPGWVMPLTGSLEPVQGMPFSELLSLSFTGLQIGSSYFLQPP